MSDWVLKLDAARLLRKRMFVIETEAELVSHLDELAAHQEGSGMLIHRNKEYLLFGIQAHIGFCSFDPHSTKLDYLWVTNDTAESDEGVIFNFGNTDTEIPKRRCIPWTLVESIVVHFYQTGTLLKSIRWEPENE